MDATYPEIEGYRIDRELEIGGFGQIYLATRLKYARQVIVKTVKAERLTAEGLENLNQEAELGRKFRFEPHITEFIDFVEDKYLIFEYYPDGTLREQIQKNLLMDRQSCQIIIQLCDALIRLSEKDIIHCDIKPENILIMSGKTLRIKLCDVGSSKIVSK